MNPLEKFLAEYGLDPDLKLIHPISSAVIFDEAGNVLAAKRSPNDPGEREWELFGGGRDEEETDTEAAERETSEESKESLKPRFLDSVFPGEIKRIRKDELPFPATLRVMNVPGVVKGVKPVVELDDSHVEYRWISPDELREETCVLVPILKKHVIRARELLCREGWLS